LERPSSASTLKKKDSIAVNSGNSGSGTNKHGKEFTYDNSRSDNEQLNIKEQTDDQKKKQPFGKKIVSNQ
jgi:hypothetical protein